MTRRSAVCLIAVLALFGGMGPAGASNAYAVAFSGNMATSGTWAPLSANCGSNPCPSANSFWFTSATAIGFHGTSFGSVSLSASGSFTGWCNTWTGTGTITASGVVSGSGAFSWTSGFMQGSITIAGTSHALTGYVSIRPINGDCVTTKATQFLIAGQFQGA